MAHYALLRHKVKDFPQWKAGYDAHLAARQQAGFTEKYLLRSAQDPNEVVMLFEVADLDRAQALIASAETRERMQQAGVVDGLQIHILTG